MSSSLATAKSSMEFLDNGGEMGARMRAFDWANSALGPVDAWPQSLRTSVSICLNSRFPILLWWGPELVKLYNDAYIGLIGTKHPGALGTPGKEVWTEIWEVIGPMLARVLEQGEPTQAHDLYLPLVRNGYSEECYFTFSYSPIHDETGATSGVFTPVFETTDSVIGGRRLSTLRDLAAARPGMIESSVITCELAAKVLSQNAWDVPWAGIYLFDNEGAACLTATTLSAAEGQSLPSMIDLKQPGWGCMAPLQQGGECVLPLPSPLLPVLQPSPWDDLPRQAIALPLLDSGLSSPIGFLVAGVSPRKRLDAEYLAFFAQVASSLSTSIGEAKSHEREAALRIAAENERNRIHRLFMAAPAGIAILSGPDLVFTFANDLYVAITQRVSASDLLDKPIREALPELAGQSFFDWLDAVYATGRPFRGTEAPAKLKLGATDELREYFFNFAYEPTLDVFGKVDGILVHVVDVTGQVVARREVEAREEQFRALADSIPHLAWMAKPDGDIFWYNQRWYAYTGKSPDDMAGWGWQVVHDPHILPEVLERYRHSLATGEAFDMSFPLRGADGVLRTFLTRAVPVRDSSGTIVRWFGTNTEIDTQRKTEEALRQSEKLAVVGRLASSIAHEINNPLEAVINLIYLAKSSSVDDVTRNYLADADQELARVSEITSQTLRFHKQQAAAAPADVVEILNSVLALYRGKLSRDGVELQIEARETPPLVCFASEIRQVLANLVGNALDAMPQGGTLSLRIHSATDWRTGQLGLRITVSDTGHGMPPDVLERIYEPFFTTKGATGTGLGLWVSSGIVENHKGSLRVRSKNCGPRAGTTFSLILPYGTTFA